jgi:hypothetical protein
MGVDVESVGSTTFKRQDLERGFEADKCFYFQHAEQVRVRDEIDLAVDPPPDLIVDVDIKKKYALGRGLAQFFGMLMRNLPFDATSKICACPLRIAGQACHRVNGYKNNLPIAENGVEPDWK